MKTEDWDRKLDWISVFGLGLIWEIRDAHWHQNWLGSWDWRMRCSINSRTHTSSKERIRIRVRQQNVYSALGLSYIVEVILWYDSRCRMKSSPSPTTYFFGIRKTTNQKTNTYLFHTCCWDKHEMYNKITEMSRVRPEASSQQFN